MDTVCIDSAYLALITIKVKYLVKPMLKGLLVRLA